VVWGVVAHVLNKKRFQKAYGDRWTDRQTTDRLIDRVQERKGDDDRLNKE